MNGDVLGFKSWVLPGDFWGRPETDNFQRLFLCSRGIGCVRLLKAFFDCIHSRSTSFEPCLHGLRPIQPLMFNPFLLRSGSAFSPSTTSWRWWIVKGGAGGLWWKLASLIDFDIKCLKKRYFKLASKGCPANRADASRCSTWRNPVEDRVTGYRAPI